MNKKEAEEFVYKSYLKAEKYQNFNSKDSDKRRPDLTRDLIRGKSKTPCVLITGSKGKGSVANMISQILQTELKVGLMTSPHIIDFCERFKIDGKNISDEDFIRYMTLIQPEIEELDSNHPQNVCISPMGIQADLGLSYFNDNQTEFNVFECGKGAKFDDVNNIIHQYAVINSIFLEHTRELGVTVEEIAEDKSHIITGNEKCVFVAPQEEGVRKVIEKRAKELKVELKIYGRDFSAKNVKYTNNGMNFDVELDGTVYEDITVPLMGEHQARNCALALAMCKEVLLDFNIDRIKAKLKELEWPGRMEIISKKPFIMLDTCINGASCQNVKNVIEHLGIDKVTTVIGIPDDKDYLGVVREMSPVADNIILTKSHSPHYIFTDVQCEKAAKAGIKTLWTNSIEEALERAVKYNKPVVILGTTSVVSEVKEKYKNNIV